MAVVVPSGTDSRPSSYASTLQSLLSHLPLLNTAVSSSPSAESLASTRQLSPLTSASSVYTACSEPHTSPDPSPVAPQSPQWTSFYLAHPPPKSRTHNRRRRSHPPLILQLRRTRPGSKHPRPDLEVYPALGSIRKDKRAKSMICGAHELSREDLVITRYSTDDDENVDVSPLALEVNASDCDGIIAVLHRCTCYAHFDAPQDIILVHGSTWAAYPLAPGGYTLSSQTGTVTKPAHWLPQHTPGRRARAATNPATWTAPSRLPSTSISQFAFITTADEPEVSETVTRAVMDKNAIHILETQDVESTNENAWSNHAHLTALAVATGIWVAGRQGWVNLGLWAAESKTGSSSEDKLDEPRKVSISGSKKMLRFMHRRRASG